MRDKAMLIEKILLRSATGPMNMVCRAPASLLAQPLPAIRHSNPLCNIEASLGARRPSNWTGRRLSLFPRPAGNSSTSLFETTSE